jgi:hypothetical protein
MYVNLTNKKNAGVIWLTKINGLKFALPVNPVTFG